MKPVLCIAGPTASGKSDAALVVAKSVNGEIINADALQVYSDIRILSARPDKKDTQSVPHHLYGYVSGRTHYSGGQWVRDVMPVILEVLARGKVPILVGGTGLYFRSLFEGLASVPDIDPDLVRDIDDRISVNGIQSVLAEAEKLDPIGTARLQGEDPQRLTRLLSVIKQTGQPLHLWQSRTRPEIPKRHALRYVLLPPRDRLYERINLRFEDMVAKGGLKEAREVFARYGPDGSAPMLKAIGLSHLLRHLKGELSYDQMVELAKRDTRRFAKRQMTWFRNQCSDWEHKEELNINMIEKDVHLWEPS